MAFRFLMKVCSITIPLMVSMSIMNILDATSSMELSEIKAAFKTEDTWAQKYAKAKVETGLPIQYEGPLKSGFKGDAPGEIQTVYGILGIPDCSPDSYIEAAHAQLVRKLNPARLTGAEKKEALEKIALINKSYNFLINSSDRCTYDYDIGCGIDHSEECFQRREEAFQKMIAKARAERKAKQGQK